MTRRVATRPRRSTYDVIVVGGAVMGASVSWFLSAEPDFTGRVLVVERDPTYEFSSTARTNSCMRQQFSNPLNVQISQFGAEFVRDFATFMGPEAGAPELFVHHFGYMYLAGDDAFAATLRANQAVQAELGCDTRIMDPSEIAEAYPFYALDDIVCGSHNLTDEGYFDSGTMFDTFRRVGRDNGVEYVDNTVIDITRDGDRVVGVVLASGEHVGCGVVVNAAGPRGADVAEMASVHIPVERRKRYTFVFDAAERLDRALPLTIDPSGVHVRSDGEQYMAGCSPDVDPPVAVDDFTIDPDIFETKVWPALAHRIPAFERIRVTQRWAGHYAYNRLDANAIVGPHPEVTNLVFANGFSGHGMQQSPAVGRGVAEWITHGTYRTLDLTPLGYERIAADEPLVEGAII